MQESPRRVRRASQGSRGFAYFDELLDAFFSPPWLLRLLEALALLREDLESLFAELRSDLLRELLLDCFVAMLELLVVPLRSGSPL